MAKPKQRGTFWVVTTHVLTTGFAMPLLGGIAAAFIVPIITPGISSWSALAVAAAIQALAYVGGAYYSLSYLRKVAIIANPLACITPSIVFFAALAALGFGYNAFLVRRLNGAPVLIGIWLVFYIAITFLFTIITRRGFAAMHTQQHVEGFPVLPASDTEGTERRGEIP
jgi:hypothetical protein